MLFAPNDRKYWFSVIHVGPTNAYNFRTAMMKNFKDELNNLSAATVLSPVTFEGKPIPLSVTHTLIIVDVKMGMVVN